MGSKEMLSTSNALGFWDVARDLIQEAGEERGSGLGRDLPSVVAGMEGVGSDLPSERCFLIQMKNLPEEGPPVGPPP